jgi:predicted amidohydrolase YtcJ
VADRPAQLTSHDGHSSWVSTAALQRAGITASTPNPPNGVIVKDLRTGEPTGLLKGAAMSLVSRRIPAPTRDERARALQAAVAEAHINGITSLQDASGDPEDFSLFAEARRSRDLDVRIYSALAIEKAFTDIERTRLLSTARRYPDDPLFKSGVVKITLDGRIESHTAAMLSPYAKDSAAGSPKIAPDDLNRIVRLIDAEGWQVMTHASGDRAVRMALDAYEHAARSNAAPDRGRRHRIEHAETVDRLDLPRFGLLDVLASMQPFSGSPSSEQIGVWSRSLGLDRALRGWPYDSILAGGGRLAFGSDWPAFPLNPMLGMHAAVTRATPEGRPADGWNPDQRLSLEAAVDAYTSGAAWASFDEQRKGRIAPEMLADLVVLSEDIFDAPLSALVQARVAVTIFDGKVVYRRDRGTN